MKVGFQTVLWGRLVHDLDLVLAQLAAIGYQGVEFAQAREELRVRRNGGERPIENVKELLQLTRKHGLELLGFAGGTLKERMEFCGDYRPPYLYVDSWDHDAQRAITMSPPFTLALHPHQFMPIRSMKHVDELFEKIDVLFQKEDRQKAQELVKFLPDTAHLTIVENDPAEALRKYKDRLAAVHLKDWLPYFGRYSHRYARGFVPLGQGIVAWERPAAPGSDGLSAGILQTLTDIAFDGWLVAELDGSSSDPAEAVFTCAQWLADKHLMPSPSRERLEAVRRQPEPIPHRTSCPAKVELEFLRVLSDASGKGRGAFYQSVTDAFFKALPCQLVKLWIFSPEDSHI
jgi:sugar phosphate isomerase/epimerase